MFQAGCCQPIPSPACGPRFELQVLGSGNVVQVTSDRGNCVVMYVRVDSVRSGCVGRYESSFRLGMRLTLFLLLAACPALRRPGGRTTTLAARHHSPKILGWDVSSTSVAWPLQVQCLESCRVANSKRCIYASWQVNIDSFICSLRLTVHNQQ